MKDPRDDAPAEEVSRDRRKVGVIAHALPMQGAVMASLLAAAMVNPLRELSIMDEVPRRHTDPIKDRAMAEAARVEIEAHQTRMQRAEDKRVRKMERNRTLGKR